MLPRGMQLAYRKPLRPQEFAITNSHQFTTCETLDQQHAGNSRLYQSQQFSTRFRDNLSASDGF